MISSSSTYEKSLTRNDKICEPKKSSQHHFIPHQKQVFQFVEHGKLILISYYHGNRIRHRLLPYEKHLESCEFKQFHSFQNHFFRV